MNRRTSFVLVVMVVVMIAMGDRVARAQDLPPCPPGQVCEPVPCFSTDFSTLAEADCTTLIAPFSPTMDTWTYVFDGNNAIKIGTNVQAPFALKVDMIRISQADYAAFRRHPDFADTVCNPSFAPPTTDCVFYRVHGEAIPQEGFYEGPVDYKIFWNVPPIQGNKHDWMLLRAPCSEFLGDGNLCVSQMFSIEITNFVDRKPPVGTDPVVGGEADGWSDYIVGISNRHPHKGIPPTLP